MVLHLLVYLIHVCDQLGEALVFCACIYIQYCRHGLLYFHATQWTTFCEDTRISTEHGGPLRNSPRTVFVVPIRSWIKTKHGTRCF